jgi:hypothetical protein
MAKELPFFKFEPSEWDSGNIQICSREVKGLFIDLCALYWNRVGELPYALALQKLCNGSTDALQELIDNQIIQVIEGNIFIEFLEEQLLEFGNVSEKRRNAAKKRWLDANALQMQSKSNAIREDKRREEKIRGDSGADKSATLEQRQLEFRNKVAGHLEIYGKEMLRAFYDYWTEMNEGGRKMRFEMQKVFDIQKRLVTWSNNEKKGTNGKRTNGITADGTRERLNRYTND